jgi:hypothetical protein
MTRRPVVVLEDGTRLYSNRTRYTPVPAEQRKNSVRKPDDPRAIRWKGDWLLPLPLLDEAERSLPETIPDTVAFDHAWKKECRCPACRRPQARQWRLKWRRQMRRLSSANA